MTRSIHCRLCHPGALYEEDVRMGWKQRIVYVAIPSPTADQVCPLTCDYCNRQLGGEIAAALTRWQGDEVPLPWESQYGTVISPETKAVADALTGEKP